MSQPNADSAPPKPAPARRAVGPPKRNTSRFGGPVVLAVKIALLAGVSWFVGAALVRAFGQVDWTAVRFRPLLLAGGAALLAASILVAAQVTRAIYARLGVALRLGQAVSLYTVPMLGNYLPGRVFGPIGHVAIAGSFGVPGAPAAAAVGLLTGLGLLASVVLGFALLLVRPPASLDAGALRIGLGICLAGTLVAVHPRVYFGGVNLLLRAFKRPPIDARFALAAMGALLGGMAAYALIYVAGFAVMATGIVSIPASAAPTLVGAICLANAAGFVAIFAPAGLGVREGVLLVLLTPVLGTGTAAVVVVALRLMQTVADVALAGAGLVLMRRRQSRKGRRD